MTGPREGAAATRSVRSMDESWDNEEMLSMYGEATAAHIYSELFMSSLVD